MYESLIHRICDFLEKNGVQPTLAAPLKVVSERTSDDDSSAFGESLPAGIVLHE
jgi:hypothetical protein